jgi:hypothetical protein
MTTRTTLVVLLAVVGAALAIPGVGALDVPGGQTSGDLCVNSVCGPELLPIDCSVTLFFPSARCGFG